MNNSSGINPADYQKNTLGGSSLEGHSPLAADLNTGRETPRSNGAGDLTEATAASESEFWPDSEPAAENGTRKFRWR